MSKVLLVAFDLDGTFLDDNKEIPEANKKALERMREQGIYAVPCTGRLFRAIPEPIREHPAIRYAITENGAGIYDKAIGKPIYNSGITYDEVVPLIEYGKTIECMYDCYQDGWGWIPKEMYERVPDFLTFKPVRDMLLNFRTPLEDFEGTVRERGTSLQKFQYFFSDMETRDHYLPIVQERFPEFEISKSSPLNIEINGRGTNKGQALMKMAEILQIPIGKTAAFGDDINDLAILQTAGYGVAMGNATDAVKSVAGHETGNNNEGGFDQGCRRILDI